MDVKKYIRDCQLVVHAGGMGERWSGVTNGQIVKPRTEVGKNPRPMIDWVMLPFVKAGVREIFPSLWYKAETLIEHCDKVAKQTDLKFTYLVEPENKRLGRAGIIKESIKKGLLDPERPIISTNGSDIIAVGIEDLIRFHLEGVSQGLGVTVVGATDVPTDFGQYRVDPKTKRVLGFKEKPFVKIGPDENVNTGLFVFDPSVNSSFLKIGEESYPINIEDLKGDASESIFNKARSYTGIAPLKQWVFFKSPKHFKDFGEIDFEKFLGVESADTYLGKYENGN